ADILISKSASNPRRSAGNKFKTTKSIMPRFFVDADISVAKTIDTAVYTSPEVFEEMKEKIFSTSWQFIGNTDLVDEKNNCYPVTLLPGYIDEPLLLTKDINGGFHCMSNVCTHRGNL